MSIPESDEKSIKKSHLKIFGRKKQKRPNPPKLLRLPDSAVSAKTISGARHIAISIPIQYDYLEERMSPLRQHPVQRYKRPSPVPGAVIVLKPYVSLSPVHETQESQSQALRSEDQAKRDSRNVIPETTITPAVEPMDIENGKPLENYYSHVHSSDLKPPDAESYRHHNCELSAYTANIAWSIQSTDPQIIAHMIVPTNNETRRNSQRSQDSRHSGGTAYSTASIYTHSRKRSSISIEPSTARIQSSSLNFPPRSSSVSNIHFQQARTFDSILRPESDGLLKGSVYSHKAGSSVSSHSVTPTFFGTAEIAKTYTPILPSPLPSPAPTRNLPKLPGNRIRQRADSPCVPHFMPRPSPPPHMRVSTQLKSAAPEKTKSDETMVANCLTRQERVKTRKAKDMAALRENTKRIALSDISREASLSLRPNSAPQLPTKSSKRRVLPKSRLHQENKSSISSIMIVAESSPFTGYVRFSDLALPSPKRSSIKRSIDLTSGSTISILEHYTPPHSMASAFGSDSETLPRIPYRRESRLPASSRSAKSGLDARREERRARRNLSAQEKELDARLTRIERDNAILLTTLGGIAKSFSGLSLILSERELDGANVSEQKKGREILPEPVVGELQGAAGRVSGELTGIEKETYEDEFEFDSDGMWDT